MLYTQTPNLGASLWNPKRTTSCPQKHHVCALLAPPLLLFLSHHSVHLFFSFHPSIQHHLCTSPTRQAANPACDGPALLLTPPPIVFVCFVGKETWGGFNVVVAIFATPPHHHLIFADRIGRLRTGWRTTKQAVSASPPWILPSASKVLPRPRPGNFCGRSAVAGARPPTRHGPRAPAGLAALKKKKKTSRRPAPIARPRHGEEPRAAEPGAVGAHGQDERHHPLLARRAVRQQRPAHVVGFPRLVHGHLLWGALHHPDVADPQVPVYRLLPLPRQEEGTSANPKGTKTCSADTCWLSQLTSTPTDCPLANFTLNSTTKDTCIAVKCSWHYSIPLRVQEKRKNRS